MREVNEKYRRKENEQEIVFLRLRVCNLKIYYHMKCKYI